MKRFYVTLLVLISVQLLAQTQEDSVRLARVAQMAALGERWKTEMNDSFMCKTYCPTFDGRPAYLHDGLFPSGSEFDFMKAKEGDILGPYVDGNCVSLYKYIGRKPVPDSIRYSQILVAYKGAREAEPYVTRSREEARLRADSLCYELRTGKIFMDEIMVMESDDVSGLILNRGHYGWMTRNSAYPASFLETVFSQPAGAFVVTETDRGFHVVAVEETSHAWDCYAAWEIAWCIDSCYDRNARPIASPAEFPGGSYALDEYLNSEKTKYDSLDVAGQFDFPVLVFFDVMEDGSAGHVEILYQYWITPGIVRDLTKLVKSMPKWKPAQTCDGPVTEGQAVVIYL